MHRELEAEGENAADKLLHGTHTKGKCWNCLSEVTKE